jgi:MscS family membrane protein
MQSFFEEFYKLNIETGILWWVLGAIALTLLIKRYLSKYIARLIVKGLRRAGRRVDEPVFYQLLITPMEVFLVYFIILLSLDKIRVPTSAKEHLVFQKLTLGECIDALTTILVIMLVTWILLRVIDFIAHVLKQKANLTAGQSDDQLIVFFKEFFKVIIVIIGFLLILRFAFGYNINNLVTGLGIMGAAIALATKESLENLIASFVIFFDKPFTTGDVIKVHDVTGEIERIGLRSTRIRTENKTFVTVPNKQMVDSIVDNQSLRTQRKAGLLLHIDTNTTPEKLQQLMQRIRTLLADTPEVENHSVQLQDIGKDAYLVPVDYFTTPIGIEDFNQLKTRINFAIIELMKQARVALAGQEMEVVIEQRGD